MRWITLWPYYIPSLSSIGHKLWEELDGNEKVYRRTDGQTDGRTDAEWYNIIRPFFKRAYKKGRLHARYIFPHNLEQRMNFLLEVALGNTARCIKRLKWSVTAN